MRRDLDLIRAVLLTLESAPRIYSVLPAIDDYSGEQCQYHLKLLVDAHLVHKQKGCGYRLTWEGHEFLDNARSEDRWQLAKACLERAKGFGFEVFKKVLADLAVQQLGM